MLDYECFIVFEDDTYLALDSSCHHEVDRIHDDNRINPSRLFELDLLTYDEYKEALRKDAEEEKQKKTEAFLNHPIIKRLLQDKPNLQSTLDEIIREHVE